MWDSDYLNKQYSNRLTQPYALLLLVNGDISEVLGGYTPQFLMALMRK